jgi:hypothetical protein
MHLRVRKIIIIFLVITVSVGISVAQSEKKDSLKCSIEMVHNINKQIENCTDNLILDYLQTFGEECKNNIEYSEFSNEVLFKLLQGQPEQFCKVLDANKSKIDFNSIIQEIENPLLDLVDLQQAKERILEIEISAQLKKKLIPALDKAIVKTK